MTVFAKDRRTRVLGAADCAALCMTCAAAVWSIWHGHVAGGAVALLWCVVWTIKAFMLEGVAGSWFPARFGMNATGVYDTWWWWAIAGNLLWCCALLWFGMAALDGDAVALLACMAVAASMGRATVSHALAGWLAARRMTARTPGGE